MLCVAVDAPAIQFRAHDNPHEMILPLLRVARCVEIVVLCTCGVITDAFSGWTVLVLDARLKMFRTPGTVLSSLFPGLRFVPGLELSLLAPKLGLLVRWLVTALFQPSNRLPHSLDAVWLLFR